MFKRDGDDEPAQPGGERGRLLQVAQAAKGPEIRFLRRVLGQAGIPQHAPAARVRRQLRLAHQASKGLEVSGSGPADEFGD